MIRVRESELGLVSGLGLHDRGPGRPGENAPDRAGDAVRDQLDGAVLLRVFDAVGVDHSSPDRSILQEHGLRLLLREGDPDH